MKLEPGNRTPDEQEAPGSVLDALDNALATMDIRFEAAALVASMRVIARKMDNTYDGHLLTKLANTLMRQQIELREWLAPTAIAEDPFDALARSLHAEDA